MSTNLIVILTSGAADTTTNNAISHLASLAEIGLVLPFLTIDTDTVTQRGTSSFLYSTAGREAVELYEEIANAKDPRAVRLLSIVAHEDAAIVSAVASAAVQVAEGLRRRAPGGVLMIDARIAAVPSLHKPTVLTKVFTPLANANIVVIPEDRGSHTSFANPLAPSSDKFSAGLAYETAALAGMWMAMEDAWIDGELPGVIDVSDAKVLLVQSQTRIMDLPPPMIEEALAAELIYPTPLGFEVAPDQRLAAAKVADFIYRDARDLQFQPPDAFDERRESLSLGDSVKRIGREFGRVAASSPARLARAAVSNIKHVVAYVIAHVLGDERTIEPFFDGQSQDFPSTADLPDINAPQVANVGTDGIDQAIWTRFVDSTLAIVDGGGAAGGLPPLVEGARRFAIVDPEAISVKPTGSATAFADLLLREQLDTRQPTLLGRLAAHVQSAQMNAKGTLARARAQYEELFERIKNARHAGTPPILKVAIGVCLALIVLTFAIPGGIAESLGIDDWARSTRVWIGSLVAFVAVLVASASLGATLEARKRQIVHQAEEAVRNAQPGHPVVAVEVELRRAKGMIRVAWGVLAGVLVLGIFGAWRWSGTRIDTVRFGILRVGEVIAIGVVIVTLVVVIAFALTAAGMSGADSAARFATVALVTYSTLAMIGGIVDRRGWYGTHDFSTFPFARVLIIEIAVLVVLGALAFGYRTREHFRFNDSYVRLINACDAARHCMREESRLATASSQFLGTAVSVARMVWFPFGVLQPSTARQPIEVSTPPLKKMQVARFDVAPSTLPTLYSRIRTKLTDQGWLRRQYSAAMDGYQRSYMQYFGKNPGGVPQFRPEADRTTGPRREGLRWEFADQLLRGDFDGGLKLAGLVNSGDATIRDLVLSDGLLEGPVASLREFVNDIASGEAAPLNQDLFVNLPIVMAGDDRARFHSDLWWPSAVGDDVQSRGVTIHSVEAIATDTSTIVTAVRTERSQAFPLRRLPLAWLEDTPVVDTSVEQTEQPAKKPRA